MAPGLNRGEKIDKPENPNKPEKPENPGSEDKDDKKANKANKGTHIYTYDELNRMVSSNIAKVLTEYTYDTLGNLVLETSKNKSVDYEYNELNQLVKKTTSQNEVYTYSYDKRGNRTAETGKKASQSFVYDATNRMVEGTNWKGDKSAYTYNGLGLRVNNLVTTHAGKTYDRDYVIDYTSPENDDLYVYAMGNGQLEYEQRHVYAGSERLEQITEKGKGGWERTLYVHEDVMGNTRYYTKATGQNFAELQYDAWGQPDSPNKLVNNDHGNYVFATFTGHIYDPVLDIYFAEARFYDAINRTWMAMDPAKDGLNWYQYCFSNPTTYWDLTGLFAITGASFEYFPILDGSGNLMLNTTLALYQSRLEKNIGLLLSAPLTDEYRTQLQLQNQELLEAWLELRGDAIRIVNNQKESSSSKNDPYADVEFGHPIHRGDYLQRDITDLHVADRAARIIFHEDTLPAGQDAIAWVIFNRTVTYPETFTDPDMPQNLEGVLMSDSGTGLGGFQVFSAYFFTNDSAPDAFSPLEYVEKNPYIYTTKVNSQDAWDHAVELGKILDTITNDETLSIEQKREMFGQQVPWPFDKSRPTDGSEWEIGYYKSVRDTSQYRNGPYYTISGTRNVFGFTP